MQTRCTTCPRPTRRGLLAGMMAASAGLMLPRGMFAQDATPAPAGDGFKTQTREEFTRELLEELDLSDPATTGGSFVDSNVNDINTIHPLFADDADSLGIVGLVYDGLIGGDPRTGGPAPNGLADWWEVAEDQKTYTFHLNQSAKWHDGTPVTSADVQFSFDALANPEIGSSYMQGFVEATESWRAVDDYTFEVVAKEPLFTFLYDLVTWVIPKHIWEPIPVKDWRTDGGATGQDPARVVGSAAWKFGEWRQGESLTFNRNDEYYDKVPYLDSYVILIRPDQTAVINSLLNDEIDVSALEPADVETVKNTAGLTVATYPTRGFSFYMTNMDPAKTELFQDVEVRQALLHGLNRDSVVHDILLDNAEVAIGTQPVISYAYAPDRLDVHYTYDVERAKELLTQAGWEDSDGDGVVEKDGTPLAFEMIYPSGSATTDQIVAYYQDAWKAIGVNATPHALEFAALVDVITGDHNFEMALLGFNWDATFIQDAMFGCDSYEGGFNMVKYCNPEVDALNDKAKRTFPLEERTELVIEATNLVNNDLPVAVTHFSRANVGFSDRLQNYRPGPWGGVPIGYVWIQE
ncbi:MAG: ABC transporter substrate-binding protein [Thermomicrobiales bacterium]